MEPVMVPGPPPEAFNKHRRMSDLIKAQTAHFKHIEEKLPTAVRRSLPQHRIVTEDDAARYIASMTKLLVSRGQPTTVSLAKTKAKEKSVVPIRKDTGLAIAAVAEGAAPKRSSANKKNSSSTPKRTR